MYRGVLAGLLSRHRSAAARGQLRRGTINAYCKDDEGEHGGTLRSSKRPLVIDGLWGIAFGNDHSSGLHNVLYFTAGPDEEENGYFGKIEVVQ